MAPTWFPAGGFVADNGGPAAGRPLDWYVWHFTHVSNLSGIVEEGALVSEGSGVKFTNVASEAIKDTRRTRLVQPLDGPYPSGLMVADHVPWYVAARSPMLYCVCKGYNVDYHEGPDPLVFLGMRLGDLAATGATWCFSDRNAATVLAEFSVRVESIGTFMDFDLLTRERWNNTEDDQDRKSRRAAEVLVAHRVPIELISQVVTYSDSRGAEARAIFADVSGDRQYVTKPELYY